MERLTEPLHLNVAAAGVALAGGLRAKIAFDLIVRQPHAYGLLHAADLAIARGLRRVTVVELGVGGGTGLLNLCDLAQRIAEETGVCFDLVGFDTGAGMPPPGDYRDHPELYKQGWFPMDEKALAAALPDNARLIIGDIADTIDEFAATLSPAAPLGFATLDVDTYSSTRHALRLFTGPPDGYFPYVPTYVDDIALPTHTRFAGELLAIDEFNAEQELRKVDRDTTILNGRVFQRAEWLTHMFKLHVMDHPERTDLRPPEDLVVVDNPYIGTGEGPPSSEARRIPARPGS